MQITVNTNAVASDPSQYFTLAVDLTNGVFTWSVIAKRSDGATGNVVRNNIYGLTVNIGGKVTNIGDIAWGNYTVGSVLRSGTVALSSATVNNGAVTVSVSGNFYYGTWNTAYRCYGSASIPVATPTIVIDPNYTLTNDYQGAIVGGITDITFEMYGTVGTEGDTIDAYQLYVDGVQVYNGASSTGTIKAPSTAGSHTVYAVAVESNGATGQSASISITVVAYTPPSFTSLESVRWSTGDSQGESADDGTYAKLTPSYVQSKVGNGSLPTYCDAIIMDTTYDGTVSSSGTSLYTGAILSDSRSYIVVYTLYDNFSGVTVVRSDTISIGGRGLDMIHDPTDGYGTAFGMKSTAGKLDSALPMRICDVDSSGNITAETDINATSKLLTSGIITRSSGKGIANQNIALWGRLATLTLVMSGDSTYRNVGENMFVGTVAQAYRPKVDVMGVGYWDSAVYVGWLKTSGEVVVRLSGYNAGYTINSNAVISWTYIL